MQNLEGNRLVVSKLTYGLWQILTWALKSFNNFHFNGLLLRKVHIAQAKKKYRGNIFHKTEDGYTISRRIDLLFQNWCKQFGKFWPEHPKVSKIFILMGFFWGKFILLKPKKIQRSYLSWNWRGIHNLGRKVIYLLFQHWHKEFDKFWSEHSKVSMIFT